MSWREAAVIPPPELRDSSQVVKMVAPHRCANQLLDLFGRSARSEEHAVDVTDLLRIIRWPPEAG